MDGLLNIDKPCGMTSHDVVQRVRRVTGIRRVGHAGTLDPLASGVLVVGIGRSTRLLEYVMGRPKTYETTVRLGQTTTTYDAEGEVVQSRPVAVSDAAIAAALPRFTGTITQTPPAWSAIKVEGVPLYKRARQGEAVTVPSRTVTVYELACTARRETELDLRVVCGSGTYIRSLAHDLGEALGCGGHVVALRRTTLGSFDVAEGVALDRLSADNWRDWLLPPARAIDHLPILHLDADQVTDALCGRPVARRAGDPEAPLVSGRDAAGGLVGLLAADEAAWRPHKIFSRPA
jgi:tRNA pseudouridine55 synthase